MSKRRAIVISASSDIGAEICRFWSNKGWEVCGTYRTVSPVVHELRSSFSIRMIQCDLLDRKSIDDACGKLRTICRPWDVLVVAAGRQEPVGNFDVTSFDKWEEGVQVNLLSQLRVVHSLLPQRNRKADLEPCVLFFAGGGTNNAVVHYSSYTMSKIALIKMCEILDAEIPDTRFVIVGPGWVKTKIHKPTLEAGPSLAGDNYQKTIEMLEGNKCNSMERVVNCCDWVLNTPCKAVRGRNYSAVHDHWGTPELENALEQDFNMYKLRRHHNDWK